MACYDGFGNLHDGRPFWVGDFNGNGRADMLFYYPGDRNWWLGSHAGIGGQLQWSFAGNTTGFGQVWDGRPFWTGNFSRIDRSEVLFYFPGDRNWWLGSHNGNQLAWSFAGNTAGFGQVWDGRPFWTGNFSRADRSEVMFYFPGDGNWWLGSHNGNQLAWSFAGNTGRPHRSRLRLHLKVLTVPNVPIATMVSSMRDVYSSVGIRVDHVSTETFNLAQNPALQLLNTVDIGQCLRGQTTQEQRDLFANRNNVGANDVTVYFVQATNPPTNGCAAHLDGRPGAVVTRGATRWTLAHEVGHVLGLNHVNDNNRLMTGNGTANITNPPPDIVGTESTTMDNSVLTITC